MTTNLEVQWVVGFVDGEGCFNLDTHVKTDMLWGIQIQPEFTVVQHERDVQILYALKELFGCGSVGVNRRDSTSTRMHYRCKSVKDLHEKIIPFFEKHRLKTKKGVEFDRFRDIVRLMYDGYHNQSLKQFLEIIEKGEQLRFRDPTKPVTANPKRTKVNAILADLRLIPEGAALLLPAKQPLRAASLEATKGLLLPLRGAKQPEGEEVEQLPEGGARSARAIEAADPSF